MANGQDVAPYLLAPEPLQNPSSSPSLTSIPAASLPPSMDFDAPLNLGDVLRVNTAAGEQTGVIRFLGPTFFANPEVASGEWIGLELNTAEGKNDGSVKGSRYFTCEPLHGIFVQRRVVIENLGPKVLTTQLLPEESSLLAVQISSGQEVSHFQEPPKTPNRNWPWVKIKSEGSNDFYYWNEESDITTWLRPESFFEEDHTPVLSPTGMEAALIQEAMAAQDSGLPSGEKTAAELAAIEWAEKEAERTLSERAAMDKVEEEKATLKAAEEKVARAKAEAGVAQQESRAIPGEPGLSSSATEPEPIRQSPWTAVDSGEGSFYYWNEETDETTWEKPADFEHPVDESVSVTVAEAAAADKQAVIDKQLALDQDIARKQAAEEKEVRDKQVALENEAREKQLEAERAAALAVDHATSEKALEPPAAEEEEDDVWAAVETSEGTVYYWNRDTDETSWVMPPDYGKKKPDATVAIKIAAEQAAVSDAGDAKTSTDTRGAPNNDNQKNVQDSRSSSVPLGWQQTTEDSSDISEEEESPRYNRQKTAVEAPTKSPQTTPDLPTASLMPLPPPPATSSIESPQAKVRNRRGTTIEAPTFTTENTVVSDPAAPAYATPASTALPVSSVAAPPAAKSPWRSTQTDDGKVYYWHRVTGETTWVQPPDYVQVDDSSDLDSDEENVGKENDVAVHVENQEASQKKITEDTEKLMTKQEQEQQQRKDIAQENESEILQRVAEERAVEEQAKLSFDIAAEKMAKEKALIMEQAALSTATTATTTTTIQNDSDIVADAARDLGPWMEVVSDNGTIYYWNEDTDETTWDKPPQLVEHEKRVAIAEQAMRKVAGGEERNSVGGQGNNPFDTDEIETAAEREARVAADTEARLVKEKEEQREQLEKEKLEREHLEKEQLEKLEREKLEHETLEKQKHENEKRDREKHEQEENEKKVKHEKEEHENKVKYEKEENERREKHEKEEHEKEQIAKTALEAKLATQKPINTAGLFDEASTQSSKDTAHKVSVNEKKDHSLTKDLIPLSNIVDNWLLVSSLLSSPSSSSVESEIDGPIHALHAALSLLKDLWYLNDPTWLRLRHRVKIGIVKDTKLYGNTSVSMGAAKVYGRSRPAVGFLNCGTGGIKYQLYSIQEGPLRLSAEHKPKNGASVHTLKVGSFNPKTIISLDEIRQLLTKELGEAPWAGQPDVPVFAFITGTLRNYWEEATREEKAILEAEIQRLFRDTGVRCLNDTFFLSSEEEGRLELVGCNAMYANLVSAGLLEQGTEVIGSFGIGRGSCQWAIATPEGQVETIGHPAGMADLKALAGVGKTVISAYRKPEKLFVLLNSLVNVENPVIALKSGCCLLLERKDYPQIKAQLTAPIGTQVLRRARISRNGSNKIPEAFMWMGGSSLDRFCAEAAFQLKLTGDFPVVYDEHGKIINSLDSVQFSGLPLLFLANQGEAFTQGTHEDVASTRSQSRGPPPPLPAWSDDIPQKMGYPSVQKNAPSALASELSNTFRSAPLPCPVCRRVVPNDSLTDS